MVASGVQEVWELIQVCRPVIQKRCVLAGAKNIPLGNHSRMTFIGQGGLVR